MSNGRHIGWVAVFVCYLLINVAVIVAAGFLTRPPEESTDDFGPLLSATDEVLLIEEPMKSPAIAVKEPLAWVAVHRLAVSPDPGYIIPREYPSRNYPKLMAGYTKTLEVYLVEYFHVTPHKLEETQ